MQQALPITIVADGQFSKALSPLMSQLEMWINFQALKADWYGNEDCSLSFDFSLIRTLEEKAQHMSADNWVVESGYAYHYNRSNFTTIAFIAIADLVQNGVGIEQAIKSRLTAVANIIALQHGLLALPST
jgi:mRNA-degrading endonuclease YafQ of YafQ-DinJ toxin-antitoxin module